MYTATEELTAVQQQTMDAIKQHLEERGFPPTVGELADQLGKTKPSIHSTIEILIRKGFIRRSPGKSRSLEIVRSQRADEILLVEIPILGQVQAGLPISAEENYLGSVQVDARLAQHGPCFALRVAGQSMKDAKIFDGDMVIVQQRPVAENSDIVVASIEGELTVKYLMIDQQRVLLIPANSDFAPIDVSTCGDFRILGKVVAKCRKLNVTRPVTESPKSTEKDFQKNVRLPANEMRM